MPVPLIQFSCLCRDSCIRGPTAHPPAGPTGQDPAREERGGAAHPLRGQLLRLQLPDHAAHRVQPASRKTIVEME